jgi:prepilin-type N-terminal cleavage/methylation domain-containing protein
MRRSQSGFTILELMIVVVVIGILAAIVLPSWASETRKSKARTEVAPVLAELANKEGQYKADNGTYLAAAACPAAPSTTGQSATGCIAAGTTWNTLRVALPEQTLYCSYQITTGTSAQTPTPPAPYTMPAQASSWYYILATCDMDGKAGNSTYFISSWDSKIQSNAEGS